MSASKENRLAPRECSVALKECFVALRECSVAPKECSVAPRECSVTPKECSVAPRECSVAPKECSVALRECPLAPNGDVKVLKKRKFQQIGPHGSPEGCPNVLSGCSEVIKSIPISFLRYLLSKTTFPAF